MIWSSPLLLSSLCQMFTRPAVATPPNAIIAAQLDITFTEWLRFGIPCVLIMLPLKIGLLTLITRPNAIPPVPIKKQSFTFNRDRIVTLAVFLITVFLWIFSKPISGLFGSPKYFDSIIAVAALIAVCALRLVRWKDINATTDWGVLLLFGGGLTLSSILGETGASAYLAELLRGMTAGWPLIFLVGALVLFVIFLTELSSNTATTALFAPIFIQVAISIGVAPAILAVPVAIAASCAFMLPVATPPNAIIFGTGLIPQRTMMRIGLWLNLIFIVVITLLSTVLL